MITTKEFRERLVRRRGTYFSLVAITAILGVLVLAARLWKEGKGLPPLELALLLVFIPLFWQLCMGFWIAALGIWVRHVKGSDALSIDDKMTPEQEAAIPLAPTAVLIPVYNEDVLRVFEGVRAVYRSVEKTGKLEHFEFFILSDSDNPNRWIEEETAWMELCKQLNAFGKIFYRKRRKAINRKSGNVADFCRRWGAKYRYMVVFDADSVMSGETLVKMVRLMEKYPSTGILQTAPRAVFSETIFGRVFQFANALYSPVFMSGLNYWQAGESSFWGHNAIIRVKPFIEHCDLPELPGKEPFGGRILSHDLVEAALMRKAGYAVWLAPSLDGSYEEGPPTLIDSLKRDRRWCQGNLQHFWLLFSPAWKGLSRMNLAGGVLNYLTSPIWLAFLLLSAFLARDNAMNPHVPPTAEPAPIVQLAQATESAIAKAPIAEEKKAWLSEMRRDAAALARDMKGSLKHWFEEVGDTPRYLLFVVTMVMLFGIKTIIVTAVLLDRKRVAGFGGRASFLASIALETVFFALLAPILMVFHTKFVVMTVLGQGVKWVTQRRNIGEGIDWREPILTFGGVTLVFGFGWGIITLLVAPTFFWWLFPVLLGITLSIPFAIVTTLKMKEAPGATSGLFRVPDLVNEPPVLAKLREHLEKAHARIEPHELLRADYGLMLVVLDPYINALHCSLLRQRKSPPPESRKYYATVAERMLSEGPGAIKREDKLALLYDIESLNKLHLQVWSLPSDKIAPWWRLAISQYNVFGREPIRQLYR